jgi:hypothetical protein
LTPVFNLVSSYTMPYVDDVHLPQFPSDLACEAAGIDADTLKNWISRKPPAVFVGENERVEAGEKSVFRFSFRRVLQIAIVAELVVLGFQPREAAWHAAQFTDGESSSPRSHKAGELFRKHYTLLIVYSRTYADVVNAKADDAWRLVLKSGLGMAEPTAAAIVNLNRIDRRLRTTLGLPLTAREGVVS